MPLPELLSSSSSVEVLSIYRSQIGERDCLHRSLEIWQGQRIKMTWWTLRKGAPEQPCVRRRMSGQLYQKYQRCQGPCSTTPVARSLYVTLASWGKALAEAVIGPKWIPDGERPKQPANEETQGGTPALAELEIPSSVPFICFLHVKFGSWSLNLDVIGLCVLSLCLLNCTQMEKTKIKK